MRHTVVPRVSLAEPLLLKAVTCSAKWVKKAILALFFLLIILNIAVLLSSTLCTSDKDAHALILQELALARVHGVLPGQLRQSARIRAVKTQQFMQIAPSSRSMQPSRFQLSRRIVARATSIPSNLDAVSYKELQALAKQHNIKANAKREAIKQHLHELQRNSSANETEPWGLDSALKGLESKVISGDWSTGQPEGFAEDDVAETGRRDEIVASTINNPAPSKAIKDGADWFRDLCQRVERPTAQKMAAMLNWTDVLGVSCVTHLVEWVRKVKEAHPKKVVLVKVGEFYEAWGYDAVMLVEHAGLNPMASQVKAGCPVANLQKTLNDLVDAGITVVVCEEQPTRYEYGKRPPRKERFIAGIVSPVSPVYCYGLAAQDNNVEYQPPPPIVGISASTRGFAMCEVHVDLRKCEITDELTEEAIISKLSSGGYTPPVLLHLSLAAGMALSRLQSCLKSVGAPTRRYGLGEDDAVETLLNEVRKELALNASAFFRKVARQAGDRRPRPLYLSSAQNLGIIEAPGMPKAVTELLAPGTPSACRHFLRKFLLHPPQHDIADAILSANTLLVSGTITTVPAIPLVPAAILQKLITAREANHRVLADAAVMCESVALMLDRSRTMLDAVTLMLDRTRAENALVDVAEKLVVVAAVEAGVALEPASLRSTAGQVAVEIKDVIAEYPDRSLNTSVPSLREAFESNEGKWRGKVKREATPQVRNAYEEVERCAKELNNAVQNNLSSMEATKAVVVFDRINNAVWLKMTKSKTSNPLMAENYTASSLIRPTDRWGEQVSNRWSTKHVEAAMNAYRRANFHATNAVNSALRHLSKRLERYLDKIVVAATFAVIVRTMSSHAEEASRRGWQSPRLLEHSARKHSELSIVGAFPYWMDQARYSTPVVKNDLDLRGMCLVTGPNMAGKSTVSRTIGSIALFASCGLLVPAKFANIPRYDALFIRQAGGDAPAEGRSAFAVEMDEARTVLRDASEFSLVTLDEVGRGTEAVAGASIGAAILEELAKRGTHGLFATHLHEILDFDLKAPVRKLRMEVEDVMGRLQPTWKISSGESRESLAHEVALDSGVPEYVLQRAKELFNSDKAASSPAISIGSASSTSKKSHAKLSTILSPSPATSIPTMVFEPSFSLKRVINVLRELLDEDPQGLSEPSILRPNDRVGPTQAAGVAALYVFETSGGYFYVGETDTLSQRVQQHRRGQAGPNATFVFVTVSAMAGGRSRARALESALQRRLAVKSFPMLSTTDALHRSFGA